MNKPPRQRKCKSCGEKFQPSRPLQSVCGLQCAAEHAKTLKQSKERKEYRERKKALKTRSDYLKEAQVAFNAYIRERDAERLCICCDAPLTKDAVGGGYDCGHYRSTGSAPHLRFHPDNAHAQTKKCNRYGAGRAVDYRIGLIKRIGLAAVEALEADQAPRKHTIEELQAIKSEYKEKLSAIKEKALTRMNSQG